MNTWNFRDVSVKNNARVRNPDMTIWNSICMLYFFAHFLINFCDKNSVFTHFCDKNVVFTNIFDKNDAFEKIATKMQYLQVFAKNTFF